MLLNAGLSGLGFRGFRGFRGLEGLGLWALGFRGLGFWGFRCIQGVSLEGPGIADINVCTRASKDSNVLHKTLGVIMIGPWMRSTAEWIGKAERKHFSIKPGQTHPKLEFRTRNKQQQNASNINRNTRSKKAKGINLSTNMRLSEQNQGDKANKHQKRGRAAAQPPWHKQQIPKCPTRCFRRKLATLQSETPNIEAKRNSFSTLSWPIMESLNPKPPKPSVRPKP